MVLAVSAAIYLLSLVAGIDLPRRGSKVNTSGETTTGRNLAATGIRGLDEVLGGGLTRERLYLIEGPPGAGKTTIALHFLLEGVRLGENVLYITLSETELELKSVAASHGWSLDAFHICEVM